jgi:NAD-dependent dihydropyrimidine dehydrogenase PreA subunit
LHVNQDLCTGCGECVDVCPEDAIRIISASAVIQPDACTECGKCADICPNGAIVSQALTRIQEPALIAQNNPEIQIIESDKGMMPARTPWAYNALAFIGRELAPRMMDIILQRIEQRIAPVNSTETKVQNPINVQTPIAPSMQMRRRRRSGWSAHNNKNKSYRKGGKNHARW